jgi:tRNA 2-(methylsulfanyl)-N6-isopentenyladenosine37 hydroxylase
MTASTLTPITQFLYAPTPEKWLEVALENQAILLIDHAHCEKKAASTALSLIYRYPQHERLLQKLSRLAREELRHFEKVLALIKANDLQFDHLIPSRYAGALHKHARTHEPSKLEDILIIGAFIEARSCERFARLAPLLDPSIGTFYSSLLKSEARHFQDYLALAESYAKEPIGERVEFFAKIEADLILSPDPLFRFHSGLPV